MLDSVWSQLVSLPVIGSSFVTLSNFAIMRLELISVFLLGMVVSAAVVRYVWNSFRQDFTSLPELNFRKAFTLVSLWGLLFVVVLTMISGAREIMSPGAWIKQGNTYVLPASTPSVLSEADQLSQMFRDRRKSQLQFIHSVLLEDDLKQEVLPSTKQTVSLPKRLWVVPETYGLEYIYVPGLLSVENSKALLAEPEFFDDGRFVLWQDGRVELIPPGHAMPYKQNGREQP